MQVYHRLHCDWWYWTLPYHILSLSATAVLGMYVGIRHTELPWYLYWIYWIAGFGVLLLLVGVGHDIMFAKIESERIVEFLKSPVSGGLEKFSSAERKMILKRSEALHSLQFRIAAFAVYSWAVPWRTWVEILNQLLFFLTL